MNPAFLTRLILDFIAFGMLVIALAYYWFSNATHEIVGTGIFVLLIAHNFFNRRWWAGIAKKQREPRNMFTKALNVSVLITIVALIVTSVMISQFVFSFLPINSTFNARRLHSMASYWAILVVAIHLGWHWSMIMNVTTRKLGFIHESALRSAVLRLSAIAIASYGAYSLFAVEIGSKLSMQMSLVQWDFETHAVAFLVYHAAIIGLFSFVAHYTSVTIEVFRHRASVTP